MPIKVVEGPRRVWNLLTSQTFSFGASLLHIEVAQVSIGAHNEYFLRHRRRSRSACYCRILWSARLNRKFGEPALKHRDAVGVRALNKLDVGDRRGCSSVGRGVYRI